jgi:DnaJ-class molecular chaperone
MNENGLIFRDVTGFIPCPDCDGQDSTADAYPCDTCYGHGVIPLCGETTLTLPAELLSLIERTAQS